MMIMMIVIILLACDDNRYAVENDDVSFVHKPVELSLCSIL